MDIFRVSLTPHSYTPGFWAFDLHLTDHIILHFNSPEPKHSNNVSLYVSLII